MSLRTFKYHEPNMAQEAVAMLKKYGGNARVMAGGIDLVPRMRVGAINVDHLINIQNIKELMCMDCDNSEGLKFRAMVTLHDLETSKVIKDKYGILYDAIHQITSVQTKHMGTAVGNLCVATSGSDVATVLMALDAELIITGVNGQRRQFLVDFYTGYQSTTLKGDEMVTQVIVPKPGPAKGAAFMNLVRTHCDCAKIIVAVAVDVENHICKEARISLGSVSPTVFRAFEAESLLQGHRIDEVLIEEASEAAAKAARPITDLRSTDEYRQEMVRVLVRRALAKAYEKAEEQKK